jgi:hypothetical protein
MHTQYNNDMICNHESVVMSLQHAYASPIVQHEVHNGTSSKVLRVPISWPQAENGKLHVHACMYVFM